MQDQGEKYFYEVLTYITKFTIWTFWYTVNWSPLSGYWSPLSGFFFKSKFINNFRNFYKNFIYISKFWMTLGTNLKCLVHSAQSLPSRQWLPLSGFFFANLARNSTFKNDLIRPCQMTSFFLSFYFFFKWPTPSYNIQITNFPT